MQPKSVPAAQPAFFVSAWQRLCLPVSYSLMFAALAWYFLVCRNADVLYALQDRGWWNDTPLFWNDCWRVPGGLLSWCGAYLTQYFFYPSMGAAILIVLWLVMAWVARWVFRVRDEWSSLLFVPACALLCSIIQLGAWLYFMKEIDYAFYHTLGLLLAIVLSADVSRLLPLRALQNGWARVGWVAAVVLLAYWPLGFYALLIPLFATAQQLRQDWRRAVPLLVASVVLIGVVPLLENGNTLLMRPEARWLWGFKFFEMESASDHSLEIPFWVAALSPLLFSLVAYGCKAVKSVNLRMLLLSQVVMLIVFAGMYVALQHSHVDDYNFHAELRMQHAVEEQRWDDVLRDDVANPGNPTREMIMFRDIALLNRGELLTRRYTFNTESVRPISVDDSVLVRISNRAADLIYYNLGLPLFGVRRAVERCMHYGYSYYTLRNLVRCAILNGEERAARKYIDMLSHSTFQRRWAEQLSDVRLDSASLVKDARFSVPYRLCHGRKHELGTDDNLVEYTALKIWAHTRSEDPLLQELAFSFSLQLKDAPNFFGHFFQWIRLHPGEPIPVHVQECAILYAYEFKVPVDLQGIQFDPAVMDRYRQFSQRIHQLVDQGLPVEQAGAMIRAEYGDTYWWDYCVLLNVETN